MFVSRPRPSELRNARIDWDVLAAAEKRPSRGEPQWVALSRQRPPTGFPKRSPFVRSDHQAKGRIDPAISPGRHSLGLELLVSGASVTTKGPRRQRDRFQAARLVLRREGRYARCASETRRRVPAGCNTVTCGDSSLPIVFSCARCWISVEYTGAVDAPFAWRDSILTVNERSALLTAALSLSAL